ncbi:exported hypothetical protein [Xanthomonas phaseoli pv. phaseoli]|uniref:Secreted protein n=1 Tax=Xanthomonas campestris pv. phaseoli TaxID=317013 RepID=A0AB38E1Y8_XANCH|nr:exported hypothetical protein [Xanthomonas phaseoli pv. phaseoli]SON87002.1 exported hypothetical protein [Xanthomonas phaseoli pv. phaseoli]SON91011.1 exported hypothetical protein [Xanthomonas phaseoli pv. phaseoli]
MPSMAACNAASGAGKVALSAGFIAIASGALIATTTPITHAQASLLRIIAAPSSGEKVARA